MPSVIIFAFTLRIVVKTAKIGEGMDDVAECPVCQVDLNRNLDRRIAGVPRPILRTRVIDFDGVIRRSPRDLTPPDEIFRAGRGGSPDTLLAMNSLRRTDSWRS